MGHAWRFGDRECPVCKVHICSFGKLKPNCALERKIFAWHNNLVITVTLHHGFKEVVLKKKGNTYVDALKREVSEKLELGVPWNELRLFSHRMRDDENELEDNHTLADYNVKNNEWIDVRFSP
jgi:hypothetical protein